MQGRVQGVGFRYAVARAARARGVAGCVSNRPDGAVEAVFEGPEPAVAALLRFAAQGPPDAEVDHVTAAEGPPQGLQGFEVR